MYLLTLNNKTANSIEVELYHEVYFPAKQSLRLTKHPTAAQTKMRMKIYRNEQSVEIVTIDRPREASIFSAPLPWTSFSVNDCSLRGKFSLLLFPNQIVDIPFIIIFSSTGIESARKFLNLWNDNQFTRRRPDEI
jgi:hypothetical protein